MKTEINLTIEANLSREETFDLLVHIIGQGTLNIDREYVKLTFPDFKGKFNVVYDLQERFSDDKPALSPDMPL